MEQQTYNMIELLSGIDSFLQDALPLLKGKKAGKITYDLDELLVVIEYDQTSKLFNLELCDYALPLETTEYHRVKADVAIKHFQNFSYKFLRDRIGEDSWPNSTTMNESAL